MWKYIKSLFIGKPVDAKAIEALAGVDNSIQAPRVYPITSPFDNRERLYNFAVSMIGRDISTVASNDVACAESVSRFLIGIGINLGVITGTKPLGDAIAKDSRFVSIAYDSLLPGDILDYESGTGNGKLEHGHVVIVAINGDCIGNNSDSGKIDVHLTKGKMKDRYDTFGGMSPHCWRVL